jgi:WD40 repeat protein
MDVPFRLQHDAGVSEAAYSDDHYVHGAEFSPDGTRILTTAGDNTARLWDARTGAPVAVLVRDEALALASFNTDGSVVVTLGEALRVWDAATLAPLAPALERDGAIGIAFSPDGRRMVAYGEDRAQVMDVRTGARIGPAIAPSGKIRSAAFSNDGDRIVAMSYDQAVSVWNAVTGQRVGGVPAQATHRRALNGAVVSPDGERAMSTSDDMTAVVWEVRTGVPIATLEHDAPVLVAAFSPDGSRVATASGRAVRLWSPATGKVVAPALEHPQPVVTIAFSPDGKRLATALEDRFVYIWDAVAGKQLAAPLQHGTNGLGGEGVAHVTTIVFSPDGQRVLTGGLGNYALVWSLPIDRESLSTWATLAERSPYILIDGTLGLRTSLIARRVVGR